MTKNLLKDRAIEKLMDLVEAITAKHMKTWSPEQRNALTQTIRAINQLAKG